MRPFLAEWPHRRTRVLLDRWVLLPLITTAIAATVVPLGTLPAFAAVDDNWAGPMIREIETERTHETGQRYRRGSDDGTYESDEDGIRPQRNSHTKRRGATKPHGNTKTASLGADVSAPAHLRPL